MKLKVNFTIVFLIIALNGFTQNKTKDEVIQLMADDTCECIRNDKESFDPSKTMKEKEMALGVCLLNSFNKRKVESKVLSSAGMDDFEALGEAVGYKLVMTCSEDFFGIFGDGQLEETIQSADVDDSIPPPPSAKNPEDLQLTGKLINLKNDAVSYFEVLDQYNKSHIFIISHQFDGHRLLNTNNYKQNFTVYYQEEYFFDISENRYVTKKVVNYLELN